jgi:hypothetical protein
VTLANAARIGALGFATLGCAPAVFTPVAESPDHTAAAARLAEVRTEDGVSRSEAEAIAFYYFEYHAGIGCGAIDGMSDGWDAWDVRTRLDYGGAPGPEIQILKRDGSVWLGYLRCVDDPHAMLNDELEDPNCVPRPVSAERSDGQ